MLLWLPEDEFVAFVFVVYVRAMVSFALMSYADFRGFNALSGTARSPAEELGRV